MLPILPWVYPSYYIRLLALFQVLLYLQMFSLIHVLDGTLIVTLYDSIPLHSTSYVIVVIVIPDAVSKMDTTVSL